MQDKKPEIKESLHRVGITDLKTIVMTNWKGQKYNFTPETELTVDLNKERKGVHMSRLVESITECIQTEVNIRHGSFEEVQKDILENLKERHPFNKAEILMKTSLVIPKKTPSTQKTTMESYDVEIKLVLESGKYVKTLRVFAIGNTVCPHAMNKCGGKTHIQRAVGMLELKCPYETQVDLESMIDCVEEAFPSKVYTLLKSEDEKSIVEQMYANPKFVEDVTRGILSNARKKFTGVNIRAKTVSEESIHKHNVIAEGTCKA